jgi:hypothetical protein
MSRLREDTHITSRRNFLCAGLAGTVIGVIGVVFARASLRFARISLSTTRWLVPWIAVLFVSATLAYAMSGAIDAGASASSQQPVIHAVVSTGAAAAVSPVDERRMLYVGLNAWIPGEPSTPQTNWSTPASTGHASPDGCCSWD